MEIPKQVKEAATGLGSLITYLHKKNGYAVYSVSTPRDKEGNFPPTGLPKVILFKDGKASRVVGFSSFKWL